MPPLAKRELVAPVMEDVVPPELLAPGGTPQVAHPLQRSPEVLNRVLQLAPQLGGVDKPERREAVLGQRHWAALLGPSRLKAGPAGN
eukprot:CAMPEP_0175516320 /NCGR_PEP_ID=MMETSP0096-20121207/14387_1 /TAXON_ID=311494 /ORGANISM="Alexandrium monilatum, Strain CCMP3105" /LENGTH=86 /DNA_ID=CAMNT_0016818611 /DNA_START=579 /DNA_END=836 /DNA_ORIENTATION=+